MNWGFLMIESSNIVGNYFPCDDLKNTFPNRIKNLFYSYREESLTK